MLLQEIFLRGKNLLQEKFFLLQLHHAVAVHGIMFFAEEAVLLTKCSRQDPVIRLAVILNHNALMILAVLGQIILAAETVAVQLNYTRLEHAILVVPRKLNVLMILALHGLMVSAAEEAVI